MKQNFYTYAVLLCAFLFCSVHQVNAQPNQRMAEQIKKLLEEKSRRTVTEQKIDSRLLQAIREKVGQPMADSTYLQPVDVGADATGNLLLDIRATVSDTLLAAIERLGATVLSSAPQYNAIRASANLTDVKAIAGLAAVTFVSMAQKARTVGKGLTVAGRYDADDRLPKSVVRGTIAPLTKRPLAQQRRQRIKKQLEKYIQEQRNLMLQSGSVNSQGDHAHRADDVRTAYGVQGQGIRIGVLSDSYNGKGGAPSDVYKGDLPGTGNPNGYTTPVTVLEDYLVDISTDEGRAMLQIVHDLCPKAQLYFATAFSSETGFANNILALRNTYNCDIIIDDVFYSDEPAFQDGIVAQAVNTVTAAGALYFSSAGNQGSVAKNTASIFEGDFNDAGSVTFTGTAAAGSVHNFGTVSSPINGDVTTASAGYYTLTWSDSYYASTNDYDLFLVSSAGTVKYSSTNVQNGSIEAYEEVDPTSIATGDRLVVFKKAAAAVRAFRLNSNGGTLANFTTGQTAGHSQAAAAYSVAAASALQTSGSPFSTGNTVETFTSDGLRRIFTNPDGSQITPGNVLFGTNGGTVRNKPDITAADGVSTTLSSNSGLNPFYGTSAAAPHAGAIAGLIKSAQPSLTLAQMRTYLTTTALDIESAGYDNVSGYGIVQTYQAMQALNPTLKADVSLASFTPVEGVQNNGNGAIDPGEAVKLSVSLKNPTTVNTTTVSTILTTNTQGITISNPRYSYGTIAAAATVSNSSNPFTFLVDNSVSCGTTINFVLTATFSNGTVSSQDFSIPVNVGSQPASALSATLGAPVASTAFYISSTGTQTGRLTRNSVVSTCSSSKTAPGLIATTGSRRYDAYRFVNTAANTQCVTSTFMATGGNNVYVAAYNNSGFVPTNPNTNYLADQGVSGTGQSFSFNVAAGQAFTIVVSDVDTAATTPYPYSLNISLSTCSNVILPVTWLRFTAVEKEGQSVLQWKVADEINADRYEIEYSTDGSRFEKIYTVSATARFAPQKTYDQVHPFPVAGNNYYRIKQVDKDGHYSYSKTELVRIAKPNSIVVAPNPATSFVKVQAKAAISQLRLYNSAGQLVLSSNPAAMSTTLMIGQLPVGQYSLVIETKDETIRKSIVKE